MNVCKLSYIVFRLYMQITAAQNDPGCTEAGSEFTTGTKMQK